jgi:hypothetical protein
MKTWHVYGIIDWADDGEVELLGAILAENIYTAIGVADERFPHDYIDEVTLAGHGTSAPTVTQAH